MKSNRKGIALLWVMLVSALIFVAILGISMRVVPQKKIENSREYAQRALAVAESGMATIMYDLRTNTPAPSTGLVGLRTFLQNLSTTSPPYDSNLVNYNSGAVASGYDSTYQVRIKKTGTSGYSFYSLGTVGPTLTPLARQAITVQYSGNFPISDYGVLSQTSIHMQGGSIDGNVYANDVIMGNKNANGVAPTFGPSFAAYAPVQGGSITGVPAGEYAYVSAISVPKLTTTRFDTYRGYWNDFLNGTGNFNGAHEAEGYPNTTRTDVRGVFLDCLGVAAYSDSHLAASGSAFDAFFTAVEKGTSGGAAYLKGYVHYGKMVFCIQPDQPNNPVTLGSKYASDTHFPGFFLEGIVVIEGDLKLDGGSQIGVNDPNDPTRVAHTAVLVTGSVSVAGGQSTLNGLLYIDSTDNKALSMKGAGGLDVTGSIVAQGGIELHSDGLSVQYHQNDIYDAEIKGNGLNPVPSSWRQISYDAFSLMQ